MQQERKIICEKCGNQIKMKLRNQVVSGNEEEEEITEQFFECLHCGRHYTVAVIDKEMRLMIQKRQKLEKHINSGLKNGVSKVVLQKQLNALEAIKQDLIYRSDELKRKYIKEE